MLSVDIIWALDMFFEFWWLLLLSLAVGEFVRWQKSGKGNLGINLLKMWGALFLARAIVFFIFGERAFSIFMPEPWYTLFFFVFGAFIAICTYFWRQVLRPAMN